MRDLDSSGIVMAQPNTSAGQKTVAAASARLAQQAAKKLKSSSPNGSKPEPENMGQLIRLKS
jgi:hypothetical protein